MDQRRVRKRGRRRVFLLDLLLACLLLVGGLAYEAAVLIVLPDVTLRNRLVRRDLIAIGRAIRHGANVNLGYSYAGRTPLMIAAIHGEAEVARLLLASGADPSLRDRTGLTARQLAERSQRREVAELLSQAEARRN